MCSDRNRRTLIQMMALFAAFFVPMAALAGESTKNETYQPGSEGAVQIDAEAFGSFQEAFDALPEGGGLVSLPAGRFEIDVPLTLSRGDVMLRGCGTATHIVNRNEDGKPGLMIHPPEGVKSIWRVQIADLRVTGNPKSGPGIMIRNVDELLLARVAAEHNGADGIVLDHCYEDPRVTGCLINYNAQTGLNLIGCHDIVVSANQFEENMDALHCIDGYNLTMTGNNLDDHLGNGVVIENTYGSIVSGNMIEECNGHGAVLRGACYGDALSANTFAHCQGEGVRLEGVRDITISANTFVLLAQQSIHALEGACQITIVGNTFSRYPFDPSKRHKVDPGSGILLENTRDVTICGNSFSATREEAIKTAGECTLRLLITGNVILAPWSGVPQRGPAIRLASPASCIVSRNLITDTQEKDGDPVEAVIAQNAGKGVVIEGNLLTGFAR